MILAQGNLNEIRHSSVHTYHVMKTLILRLFPLALVCLGLNSCVGPIDGPYGGGYSSGSAPYYGSSYSSGYAPSYYSDDDFYYYDGGARPYYGGGYASYSVGYSYYRGSSICPICHHRPCSGHHGRPSSFRVAHNDHDHDRDDHRSSSSSHSSSSFFRPGSSSSSHYSSGPTLFQHKSADNNRGAPQGAHTKDWYQDRGYSTSRLTPVTGSASSSHHSSSSNHKKDDDDKHHKH